MFGLRFFKVEPTDFVLQFRRGKAVREGNTWKVSAQTFCALLTLQGNPPSACSDANVTALPN